MQGDGPRRRSRPNKILATGHQRHYNILYDNAVDTIRRGLLGEMHYIRAQWHRGNLPGNDSWQQPLPDDKMGKRLAKLTKDLETAKGLAIDDLSKEIAKLTALKREIEAAKSHVVDRLNHDIEQLDAAVPRPRRQGRGLRLRGRSRWPTAPAPALEELIRWRLWDRTGGGLMAELGSHQLDAAGIFISGLRNDGEKALPLTVAAVGGRPLFPPDRDCEDHVYCIFEFPGPDYESDPNKKIGVTYASINGNGFGGYGETVFGTKGTLILEREQEVMLFSNSAPTTTSVTVGQGQEGRPDARHHAKRRRRGGGHRQEGPRRARSAAATPRSSSTGPGASAIPTRRTSRAASPRWRWATP